MQYFNINDTKRIEYDPETDRVRVIDIEQIANEIEVARARLDEIPEQASDEELLVWAKTNYKQTDYSVERAHLEKIIETNEIILNTVVIEPEVTLIKK